jgi:hypothetical protein
LTRNHAHRQQEKPIPWLFQSLGCSIDGSEKPKNYWDSAFSKSWGVNSIPCVFVVDADGKLYSVEARGKLEEMLPALLKKKDAPAGVGAGAGGE